MYTFIILTRFSPATFEDQKKLRNIAIQVSKRIKKDCPGVTWKGSYATLGRFDMVDVVESDDPEEVAKVAMIIRCFGHATTETLMGMPWNRFLKTL
jgi:uncharacterized protein with GYD domain